MSTLSLLEHSGVGRDAALAILEDTLRGADDGELFVEHRQSEATVWEDGRLKTASFDESQGFGMRAISGETAAYAHSTEISAAALKRAGETCRSIIARPASLPAAEPQRTNLKLYPAINPTETMGLAAKISLLEAAERLWGRNQEAFELLFVGWSGWLGEEFDDLVNKLISNGRPIIVRKRCSEEELWGAYRLARFSVFPSLLEGYGLPIAESLLSGTPVITSNFGSMAEVAEKGGCLLVDP